MPDKCLHHLCPHCGVEDVNDRDHKVYYHNGFPRCEICGAAFGAGEWVYVCAECRTRVDKLYGFLLDVPTLCKTCYDKAVEEEKKAGRVCGICGVVRKNCCC